MLARRASRIVNGSAISIIARPMVVTAARVLGPGPTRLKLVKLAHGLGNGETVIDLSRGGHDDATLLSPPGTRRSPVPADGG
ncbi:MAG TPA: hypothetical protein VG364_00190 [Candidatus Dormibacteraeota bacterium]|jgi:hypothetical protein|nr:hypothetical protein [Candidatus Dormibacteraeota bacterium]